MKETNKEREKKKRRYRIYIKKSVHYENYMITNETGISRVSKENIFQKLIFGQRDSKLIIAIGPKPHISVRITNTHNV